MLHSPIGKIPADFEFSNQKFKLKIYVEKALNLNWLNNNQAPNSFV